MPQYLKEERIQLIKERRCFSYKKRGYIAYNCPKKGKIAAISKGVSKGSNNQEKE